MKHVETNSENSNLIDPITLT